MVGLQDTVLAELAAMLAVCVILAAFCSSTPLLKAVCRNVFIAVGLLLEGKTATDFEVFDAPPRESVTVVAIVMR